MCTDVRLESTRIMGRDFVFWAADEGLTFVGVGAFADDVQGARQPVPPSWGLCWELDWRHIMFFTLGTVLEDYRKFNSIRIR